MVLIIGGLAMLLLAAAAAWHLVNIRGGPVTEQSRSPTAPTSSLDRNRVRCLSQEGITDPLSPGGESLFFSLIASAENSTVRWEQQVGYIEYNVEGNAAENRGYTAGIVGFTSKTHDMLMLVRNYAELVPNNPLSPYLEALARVDGSSSTDGLGPSFVRAWKAAARDDRFRQAQIDLARKLYVRPAVALAEQDKLGELGQFAYVDAAVMHGLDDAQGLGKIRQRAMAAAAPPAKGGDEKTYLDEFLDGRTAQMRREKGHQDTSRVDTGQRAFLNQGNLGLTLPLEWKIYGDSYSILSEGECARRGIRE